MAQSGAMRHALCAMQKDTPLSAKKQAACELAAEVRARALHLRNYIYSVHDAVQS
jgi:hypothetical protein